MPCGGGSPCCIIHNSHLPREFVGELKCSDELLPTAKMWVFGVTSSVELKKAYEDSLVREKKALQAKLMAEEEERLKQAGIKKYTSLFKKELDSFLCKTSSKIVTVIFAEEESSKPHEIYKWARVDAVEKFSKWMAACRRRPEDMKIRAELHGVHPVIWTWHSHSKRKGARKC